MPVTVWRVLRGPCCHAWECSPLAESLLPGMAPSGRCCDPRYLQNVHYIMPIAACSIILILNPTAENDDLLRSG